MLTRCQQVEDMPLQWSAEQRLFGFVNSEYPEMICKRLNTVRLALKYYIWQQRKEQLFSWSPVTFGFYFRRILLRQWHVAQSCGKVDDFDLVWSSYVNSF